MPFSTEIENVNMALNCINLSIIYVKKKERFFYKDHKWWSVPDSSSGKSLHHWAMPAPHSTPTPLLI